MSGPDRPIGDDGDPAERRMGDLPKVSSRPVVDGVPVERRVGKPDRRVRYDPHINLGSLIQALTVVVSTAAGIFSAGAYVQSLRDDLHAAEVARRNDDQHLMEILRRLRAAEPPPDHSGLPYEH